MYWGNTNCSEDTDLIPNGVKKCLEFIETHDMKGLPEGRYEIDGNKIFVNIISFDTVSEECKKYEGHKRFVDVHYMISGKEQIYVNFRHRMENISYDDASDFGVFDGVAGGKYVMDDGDYLVCMPEDIHKPGIMVNKTRRVKKAAFKIAISEI